MSGDRARELAVEALAEVQGIIGQRSATHGAVRSDMQATADIQAAVLGVQAESAEEAAVRLACVKLARWRQGDRAHRDHLLDAIGYLALALGLAGEGRCRLAPRRAREAPAGVLDASR